MTDVPMEAAGGTRRREAVELALRLEVITIAWMTVEAVGAIVAGLLARSTLLLAFGIDSVIELVSAGVLYRCRRLGAAGTVWRATEIRVILTLLSRFPRWDRGSELRVAGQRKDVTIRDPFSPGLCRGRPARAD